MSSTLCIARLLRAKSAETQLYSRSTSSPFLSPPVRRSFASSSCDFQDEDGTVKLSRSASFSSPQSSASIPSARTPRYAQTPSRMKAPVSVRRPIAGTRWECNEDPVLLDHVYRTILGEDGDRLLTDDVKWLAVTHKSFDQGRRGFNDRLAFLGTFYGVS
jgi:hypothetical protein